MRARACLPGIGRVPSCQTRSDPRNTRGRLSSPRVAISPSSHRKSSKACSGEVLGATARPAGPKRQGVPAKAVHEVIGRLLNGPPVAIRPSAELEQDACSPPRASAGADGPCRDPIMRHKPVRRMMPTTLGRAGHPRPVPSRVKGRRRRLWTWVGAHPGDEALGEPQCRHAVRVEGLPPSRDRAKGCTVAARAS